ncbi:MAG: NADH-quinone oxidoreductase subunit J, partial [Chloroflexi bacterium]|nr:NADH-quinone oxidoreductase subunit J [Chloroflexota bacterium]
LIVAIGTLFTATMVVVARNLVHAALWLILSFFGVAVVFAMLEAGFIAVVQVALYIGAIAILIIFAMMLTRKVMNDTEPQTNSQWVLSFLAAAAAFIGLAGLLNATVWSLLQVVSLEGSVAQLGRALVEPNQYVLPFEVASVLLIVALIGAVAIASEKT